jgi:flagellin-like protein
MKILRKIRKNAKALSPVVASIILIAVTVAVSIAVAAWMGALTVGFMEQTH